jgi:[CysO sulfur-carrier protein]-S-L-cysteine hydrolase
VSSAPGPTVRLPRAVAEAIVRHARDERPNEACGLVVGSALADDGGLATRYVACRNAAASPSRYTVHRDDLLGVIAELDRTGGELWGVVHSHVRTRAVPSATDIGEAAWPNAVYLLVSLADDPVLAATSGGAPEPQDRPLPELRAWRIADGTATELRLAVDEMPSGVA